MKINRLDHTKSLFPHFYDKTNDSNFTKHLKVVGEPQWNIRHKLKTVEWSRILEKPLQIWKEQTQSYVYNMHFKVIVPYLKQVNIYKNPMVSVDEEVVGYEELCSTESFEHDDNVGLYEKVLSDLTSPHRIPKDTYLLEIFTWDDYHFLKGYPENDYTVKEDNILDWRYNESFLSINIEEISYTKYLTFRVHKDKIKQIRIYKNDSLLLNELFDIDIIANSKSTDLSYYYSDDDFTNENTYLQSDFNSHFEVEDAEHNHVRIYVVDTDVDEYVFRLALPEEDFDDGVLKDTYDLEVRTFEKRYRCRQEYDKVYSKRYCGYDEQMNDCFDHDYSLDMIGRLLNVHRFRFYQVYRADDYYLSRTYPTYYDKATEDDYHYMKRMQFYISNYNHIVFPVLEFWKYYHTMATIRSRKRIVDEMDYAYLRTNIDDCYIDFDGVEEEFESETVTEYSINKATLTSGESSIVTVEDSVWHEATIVKDVYVVPDINYHLRFGVKDNSEDVTVRMICYNRQGVELRTTPVLEEAMQTSDHEYTSSDGYSYNDLLVVIPSDTVSVKMVLESNSSFSFADATFERMTVVNFDNYYMSTDEDYNSNVYELYCVYEDLPTNLRLGGDRFNILFKRSLPLTKRGFFLVDINDYKSNYVEATTDTELYVKNILMDDEDNDVYQTSGEISSGNDYESTVSYYIRENNTYDLRYFVKSENITPTYQSDDDVGLGGGSTILFEDGGVTGDKNTNYTKHSDVNVSTTSTGTTVSSVADCYPKCYSPNVTLTGDFEIEFTQLTNSNWWQLRVHFADTSNNVVDFAYLSGGGYNRLVTQNNGTKPDVGSGQNNGYADYTHTFPITVKITREGSTYSYYEDDDLKLTNTGTTNDVTFGFWSDDISRTVYKDLKIIDTNSGGSENTIYLGDEDEMEAFIPIITNEELVFTTITYIDLENNEISSDEMEQKIYSNIESHISHQFTTPTDTSKIKITISSETSAELSNIQLSRMEELTNDEVYLNED